jgi:hypothetical protein
MGAIFGWPGTESPESARRDSLNFDRFSLFQRLVQRGLCKIISQQQYAYCSQTLRNLRRRSSAKFIGQTHSRNHTVPTKTLVSSHVF